MRVNTAIRVLNGAASPHVHMYFIFFISTMLLFSFSSSIIPSPTASFHFSEAILTSASDSRNLQPCRLFLHLQHLPFLPPHRTCPFSCWRSLFFSSSGCSLCCVEPQIPPRFPPSWPSSPSQRFAQIQATAFHLLLCLNHSGKLVLPMIRRSSWIDGLEARG